MENYYRLLCQDTKFEWTDECQTAFEKLKKIMASYPIHRQPNFNLEFYIYADASHYAIGWCLAQKTQANKEYNVEFGSKLLKGSEINWTITEKECFAIVAAEHHITMSMAESSQLSQITWL